VDEAIAAWRHFDETVPESALTPLLAAMRADDRAIRAANAGRHAEAEQEWRSAVDGYTEAGDQPRGYTARGRLGVLLCETGRPEEGRALVAESGEFLLAGDDPERRAAGELRRSMAHLIDEDLAAALAAADRAAAQAAQAPDPLIRAEVQLRRAQILLALDRGAEAAQAAQAACGHYREIGDPPISGVAFLLYGDAQIATDTDPSQTAETYRAVLARTTENEVALFAHQGLGRALLAAHRPDEAVDHLVEAVAGFVAAGQDGPAAFTRYLLARAYHAADRPIDAAESAEEALLALDGLGAQDLADRCRHLLSQVYRDLSEPDQALAQLDQLVINLDGFDNLGARGQMHEEAGQILYAEDRDAQAAQRFAAAADAYAAANLPLEEVRARRWSALSWRWAEEPEQAMVALEAAEARARALPTDEPVHVWELGMLAYDGARVLIGAERLDEALQRLTGVAASFRSIEAFGEALFTELLHGELLLRMDRVAEAEPVLRAALGGAPQDSAPQQNAAWLLSETLEALGRGDEAAALRGEYGLDQPGE
jgi:tetratricopeptide (TPR) repeat protein